MAIDRSALKRKKAELAELEKSQAELFRKQDKLRQEIELLNRHGWPDPVPNGAVVLDDLDGRKGILLCNVRGSEIPLSSILNGDGCVFLLDESGVIVPFHACRFAKDIRSRFRLIGSADPVTAVAAALATAATDQD